MSSTLFDPNLPLERAKTPPASWYRSIYQDQQERRAVLASNWQVVAHLDELQENGSYVSGCAGSEPWVVTKDQEGLLHAFANVCRHNGTQVADGAGQLEQLVCPYHGWRYELDGRLAKAPRIAGVEDFSREKYSLKPLSLQVWGPLVMINSQPNAKALQLDELTRRLDAMNWAGLNRIARRTYDLNCNWKVFIDNYLDGGYHVPCLHRDLAAELDLDSYQTELFEGYSIQSVTGQQKARERLSGDALYAWVYPNLMLNRYGNMMDINVVVPLSTESCRVIFDWYAEPGLDEGFIAESLKSSEQVQKEDIYICERLQVGMGSIHFEPGPYAPTVEMGKYQFHKMLAADLKRT